MGCGASTINNRISRRRGDPYYVKIEEQWASAHKTLDIKPGQRYPAKKLIFKRRGWKTIRVFVSSTFKDFHTERNILVKKVFPDLRVWCEQRRLQLIECDLRWGVPKDFTTEATLRACLGEIDRCYQDNMMPFFINMTSERVGWIPGGEDVPHAVRDQYKWVEGLSVTEMEIMHGAYRNDNPNALFLLRDAKFIETVPAEHRKVFIDGNPVAPCKLDILKEMIRDRFPDNRVRYYDVEYAGFDTETGLVELTGLDGTFSQTVFEFFKKRIEEQYPLLEGAPDPYQQSREQHESFMHNRSECVLGRDDILSEIKDYISGVGNDVPCLLIGGAGSGKSSLMAKAADLTHTMAMQNQIPGGGKKGWHVFYHFVGAVPGSTELEMMLKRLLKEIGAVDDSTMPGDLESAAQMCCGVLNNPNTRPVILFVDALNQFDEEMPAEHVTWVPRKLAPHVRCVFSMIPGTPQHEAFESREPLPKMIHVGPLDNDSKKEIVSEMLGRYNKRLDEQQMECLLSKTSSDNPLWLSIACEELRVFGQFRQLTDKINKFPSGLLELEMDVLTRFEEENGGELLVATLCLLEVSSRGLLELELLQILGDEDNLMPRETDKDGGAEKDDSKREKSKKDIGMIPAYKWAGVYRALKPFLRPFGDSGEGRLDFYHRSLSKAVRRKYFQDESGETKKDCYLWWHTKLVDYFETVTNLQRKLEEYPVHLIAIKDVDRLAGFLTDWEIFEHLYNEDFSSKLVFFWRTGSTFSDMVDFYMMKLNNLANDPDADRDLLCRRYEMVSRFMAQAGQYVKAKELIPKAMAIEKDELGARDHRMAELYSLSAFVGDEDMKQEGYMYRSQLPRMRDIIENFTKSAELRKTHTAPADRRKLGRIKNRLAFYYSGYNLRGGDEFISADEAKRCALEAVEEAITIFKEIDDQVNVADCLTTRGVVIGRASPEQLKNYNEALELTVRLVGELHINLDRLYLNMAIYHEEMGDYYKGYEFFRKWHEAAVDLYGLNHPKTARTIDTLREPMYRRIALEKGHAVPAPFSTENKET